MAISWNIGDIVESPRGLPRVERVGIITQLPGPATQYRTIAAWWWYDRSSCLAIQRADDGLAKGGGHTKRTALPSWAPEAMRLKLAEVRGMIGRSLPGPSVTVVRSAPRDYAQPQLLLIADVPLQHRTRRFDADVSDAQTRAVIEHWQRESIKTYQRTHREWPACPVHGPLALSWRSIGGGWAHEGYVSCDECAGGTP
jgi:hypothetical protein